MGLGRGREDEIDGGRVEQLGRDPRRLLERRRSSRSPVLVLTEESFGQVQNAVDGEVSLAVRLARQRAPFRPDLLELRRELSLPLVSLSATGLVLGNDAVAPLGVAVGGV